jgi:hypothetical protein
MRKLSLFVWTLLISVALAGGSARGEGDEVAMDSAAEAYPPIPRPEPMSYETQVELLLMKAGVKMLSDAPFEGQRGHDLLLELLRSHPIDSIRAGAGSLLIRHPMLVPASLETLIPLFERIPESRAWERNHLPRGWLELRESGRALLLASPERMTALLHTSPIEDIQTTESRRDAILAHHGDLDAGRRLRDALLKCVADEPEYVDCLDLANARGLGTLTLVQERWDNSSARQRALLIRWANAETAARAFALTEISGTTDAVLRSALIDAGLPLLDANGLQRILAESLQLAAQAETSAISTRDASGLPTACSDSVPLLEHMSPYSEQLSPTQRIKLADQMMFAAIHAPEPQRTCVLQMALRYDPDRERMVLAELATRRESDGSPSAEALAALFALEGADDGLVRTVVLNGGGEKWLLVTESMSEEQWKQVSDAVLRRLEDFPKYAAEYFALMPYKVRRGEAIEPPPLLKAELRGQETALRRIKSFAPERVPALARRFEAQGTDAARFLALETWSAVKEDPASKQNRQRLAEALLTAENPNLREFAAEELAKLQGAGDE